MLKAATAQNQFGIGTLFSTPVEEAQKPQSYQESITKLATVNKNPTNVITFGANHLGKYCN